MVDDIVDETAEKDMDKIFSFVNILTILLHFYI